ncbi:MAG: ATP-dependent RNA helicase HrpA [Ornithinimicrobium sp.]
MSAPIDAHGLRLTLSYPGSLPVVDAKAELLAAISSHQVTVVAGETGSGKTTQLPKLCLELGRGARGLIGHTQPRRIAARAVAERISDELGTELGATVGYQVRFTDRSGPDTLVKVMTDGVLLAEMRHDRELRRYDTLIIDEAHERSLNIDFILGYLTQLLPRRPDLKVIITSATIDVDRFARHFRDGHGRPAPVVEVSGRSFGVEMLYRPLVRPGPPGPDGTPGTLHIDQVTGICEAVEELWTHPASSAGGPQDILVFCSGEREIRDACEGIVALGLGDTEVVPLYGRLSAAEQHRVFSSHRGRRVVVATNVAETSLTVPGIRYVVDTGTARISRYSQRRGVQRLPIEPVSRASARQRSGRCGRLAEGTAIRLYSEEDFEARPEFTDPEILRTNLASVVLAMTDLGLGRVEDFPFLEAPDSRQISDGVRLLHELQAIDTQGPAGGPERRLTATGRAIARLPLDPRLARMLIEADRNSALSEVLVIVSALSIQDPRERPADKRAQADQAHARFVAEGSDFLTMLNLWRYLKKQQKALSGSAFRRMCQREYLHYLRVREWQDLHHQVRRAATSRGMRLNRSAASDEQVHQSLVPGLLSLFGLYDRDKREYLGPRGVRFAIQPGSALRRTNPDWVMSAELVETTRLWARVNARTDPAWLEAAAAHLVKRSYAEPRWSRRRAGAVASERVTLYGVPLAAGRTVPLGGVDPEAARELFLRHALVEGDWDARHQFFEANQAKTREVADLEERTRRRGLMADDEALLRFYDERVPEHVVSGAHFDRWWKHARRDAPDLLTLTEDVLVAGDHKVDQVADFPGHWRDAEVELELTYRFQPGDPRDGVSVHVPVELLNRLRPEEFEWSVPGLREDLVVSLVKALPKQLRRHYVPAPDHARTALRALREGEQGPGRHGGSTESLTSALARVLTAAGSVRVHSEDFSWDRVPAHLRPTFVIEGTPAGSGPARGRQATDEVLAEGKDLVALQTELAALVRSRVEVAASAIERRGMTSWELDSIPRVFEDTVQGQTVRGYPALVDAGTAVDLRVLPQQGEAVRSTRRAVRRLLVLTAAPPWKRVLSQLSNADKLALGTAPHPSVPTLLQDALESLADADLQDRCPPGEVVRSAEEFHELSRSLREQAVPRLVPMLQRLARVLPSARELGVRLDGAGQSPMVIDLRAQHTALVRPGCVTDIGYRRLPRLAVYLEAMSERLDKGPRDASRDAGRMEQVHVVQQELADLVEALPAWRREDPDVRDLRWQVEELRVSLFAPRLGAAGPVSPQRIYAAMDLVQQSTS